MIEYTPAAARLHRVASTILENHVKEFARQYMKDPEWVKGE